MEPERGASVFICLIRHDADPLGYARDIHDDEHHEQGEQSACEDEQVLRLQTLVLHRPSYAFVYSILGHN